MITRRTKQIHGSLANRSAAQAIKVSLPAPLGPATATKQPLVAAVLRSRHGSSASRNPLPFPPDAGHYRRQIVARADPYEIRTQADGDFTPIEQPSRLCRIG